MKAKILFTIMTILSSYISVANAIPLPEKECFEKMSQLKLNFSDGAPTTVMRKFEKSEGVTYNSSYAPLNLNYLYRLGYSQFDVDHMKTALLKIHSNHVEFKVRFCSGPDPKCVESKIQPMTPELLRKIINTNLAEINIRGIPANSISQLREVVNTCSLVEGLNALALNRAKKHARIPDAQAGTKAPTIVP